MLQFLKISLAAVLIVVLASSCKKSGAADSVLPASPQQLAGDWTLVSPDLGYPFTLSVYSNTYPSGTPVVYQISGKGPVNAYGSTLDTAPAGAPSGEVRIRIDPAFNVTKIAETNEQTRTVENYLSRLGQVYTYALTQQGDLSLTYNPFGYGKPGVLLFRRQ